MAGSWLKILSPTAWPKYLVEANSQYFLALGGLGPLLAIAGIHPLGNSSLSAAGGSCPQSSSRGQSRPPRASPRKSAGQGHGPLARGCPASEKPLSWAWCRTGLTGRGMSGTPGQTAPAGHHGASAAIPGARHSGQTRCQHKSGAVGRPSWRTWRDIPFVAQGHPSDGARIPAHIPPLLPSDAVLQASKCPTPGTHKERQDRCAGARLPSSTWREFRPYPTGEAFSSRPREIHRFFR